MTAEQIMYVASQLDDAVATEVVLYLDGGFEIPGMMDPIGSSSVVRVVDGKKETFLNIEAIAAIQVVAGTEQS